jgi:hypothetical protein
MKRIKVDSSNIDTIGWESYVGTPDFGYMMVRFKGGATYIYSFVPLRAFIALQGEAESKANLNEAASVGKLFNQIIKSRTDLYPYRKMEGGGDDASAQN